MSWEWISFLVFAGLTAAVGLSMVVLPLLLAPRRPLPEKLAPYECGVPLLDSPRRRFTVKFYLAAIMFMIFDIETAFLIPWGVVYKDLVSPLAAMFVFLGILALGLVYVVRRGVFDWR